MSACCATHLSCRLKLQWPWRRRRKRKRGRRRRNESIRRWRRSMKMSVSDAERGESWWCATSLTAPKSTICSALTWLNPHMVGWVYYPCMPVWLFIWPAVWENTEELSPRLFKWVFKRQNMICCVEQYLCVLQTSDFAVSRWNPIIWIIT